MDHALVLVVGGHKNGSAGADMSQGQFRIIGDPVESAPHPDGALGYLAADLWRTGAPLVEERLARRIADEWGHRPGRGYGVFVWGVRDLLIPGRLAVRVPASMSPEDAMRASGWSL